MSEKINKIIKVLDKSCFVIFAYLFGSRSKGIANEKSDWDIAISFSKDPDHLPGWTVFQLEAEVSREIEGKVQITPLNGLDSPVFAFQIINDGIILIDRDPGRRIEFEAMVLRRYHDWRYFLTRHMTPAPHPRS